MATDGDVCWGGGGGIAQYGLWSVVYLLGLVALEHWNGAVIVLGWLHVFRSVSPITQFTPPACMSPFSIANTN